MRNYFLSSARLGFSAWTAEDLDLATRLWGDPQVTRLTGGPFTPAQVRARLSREITNFERHRVQYWPIFLLRTGEHVGCCGLQPRPLHEDGVEFGFQLRTAFWAQGYGREAAEAVVTYAFTALGVGSLYAGHHPANEASRRVLQGLGFRYTHEEFYPPTEQLEPCYRLARDDWPYP